MSACRQHAAHRRRKRLNGCALQSPTLETGTFDAEICMHEVSAEMNGQSLADDVRKAVHDVFESISFGQDGEDLKLEGLRAMLPEGACQGVSPAELEDCFAEAAAQRIENALAKDDLSGATLAHGDERIADLESARNLVHNLRWLAEKWRQSKAA